MKFLFIVLFFGVMSVNLFSYGDNININADQGPEVNAFRNDDGNWGGIIWDLSME